MMVLLLTLWLLAGHKQIIQANTSPDAMPYGSYVIVTDCKSEKAVTIYTDETMTVPLANPFKADSIGHISFVPAKNGCYVVSAVQAMPPKK